MIHTQSTVYPEQSTRQNPFPGLRPFLPEESHLFFGRERQVAEVVQKLKSNHFVAVIGTSGIGKSSFIYCGLLPTLQKETEEAWQIMHLRPGDKPQQSLWQALVGDKALPEGDLKPHLEEALTENPNPKLFFIDQFEELFRYAENNPEQAQDFVETLLHLGQASPLNTYVVITMRSDFIGNASRYPAFTEKLNQSQFLIPYMTREEKKQAIVGPVEVMSARIQPELVNRILDDLGESPDQLPLMQHALMRTWNEWQRTADPNQSIQIHHYENIGGIARALSVHANEAYNELPPDQRNICARIFRAITEITQDGRRIRRPSPIHEIATTVGATEAEVISIVNHFRRNDRGLLTPSEDVPLHSHTIVDISHESLIRIWTTLHEWVEKEAESVKIYLRLAEDAQKHQKGQAGLWSPPDLDIALDWRDKQKPTKAWGLRYHPTFDRTLWFLEASKQAEAQRQIDLENQRQRRRRIRNLFLGIIVLVAIIAIIIALFAWQKSNEAERQKEEAKKSEEVATKAKAEALAKAEEARKAQQAALDSANVAKIARDSANVAREKAKLEAERAEKQRQLAEAKTIEANNAKEKAAKEANIARLNKELADIEKRLADLARLEADKLRLLSIANAMAIKSIELNDAEQKALVAEQAYRFHIRSGGRPNDPDIYNGLYYALRALKGESYNQLKGHGANVRALAGKDRTQVYSAGSDGQIKLWDSQSRTELASLSQGYVHRSLAYNGSWLACVGNYPFVQLFADGNLQASPTRLALADSQAGQIWFLAFLGQSQLIMADETGNLHRVRVEGQNPQVEKIRSSLGKITAIVADGNTLVYAVGKQLFLFRPNQSQDQALGLSLAGDAESLAFRQKTGLLAVGDNLGNLYLFNLNTQSLVGIKNKAHNARINEMDFDRNGLRLATGSWDKTVKIWELSPRLSFNQDQVPITLKDHSDWVWSIEFSPDGEKLLAGCRDNLVRAWPVRPDQMSKEICPLPRNLSRDEWERFVSPLPTPEDAAATDANKSVIYYEETCPGQGLGPGVKPTDVKKP